MIVSVVWENFIYVKYISHFPCSLVSEQEFVKTQIFFAEILIFSSFFQAETIQFSE